MINKKLIEEAIDVLIPKAGGASHPVANASIAIELLKQAIATEPRFYKNQPVLVSDIDDNLEPRPALFKGYPNTSNIHPFTAHAYGYNAPCGWRYCKPDPDAVSLPNWLPVNDNLALPKLPEGRYYCFSTDNTMYCIIPEPEYLEVSDDT